ncbi:MAG: gamma-glutamyltransferase family protein [Burkholderiales bacterium]|jgi:gamma-glutamyltranspeptidase/glutathione hydrolase|nr:gamma-glutamyltransferase family protein [Burkholderiales bacterium]MCA3162283.1 gamma-glutamyltransferase family protein [Burkholderiales bacterium]MCA3163724.1 gamma-glutamyltransferase family protein [Burkholderiales bacterium]MCA3166817.1 gamma-glutamyltransferase family protein [Burkholderiales bacterium]MCA3170726.1 gamma-glutamyltransferase family protein [Burkholderiales bacterium]
MNFHWTNPYPSARTPLFARNIVSTSQPLAAQAGLRLLQQGGNAVDAAIAAAATITLTEPCSNGLGSDCFALVWDGSQLLGLNASGTAPAAWTLDYFEKKYGGDLTATRPLRGWDTVTVPGAVGGWGALHQRLGRLPFEQVLAPAIEYAERGFAISPNVQEKWRLAAPLLREQPGFAEHFLPKGRVPHVGEHFVLPHAAQTLKLIAQTHGEAFYRGELAARLAAHAAEHGGVMTEADLASYEPQWVDSLHTQFHRHTLHEIPPNGQGITALMTLGLLRHTPLAQLEVDSPDWHHWQIEAIKAAFADVYAHVSDPRSMRVTSEQLLDDDYLKSRAALIDPQRAQHWGPGELPRGGTIYLTTADESGMMVSFIQSNYLGFGSGVVVPGTGISLHNRGHAFSMLADHPNVVAPGKHPFHTIIPAFLMAQGQPQMSFGVMGANMQPQGQVQTLTRMLLAHQQPQAACDAPRWKWNKALDIEVEPNMPDSVKTELARRGHRIAPVNDPYLDFGAGQFIWRLGDSAVDGYVAASDPRRDGCAVGY